MKRKNKPFTKIAALILILLLNLGGIGLASYRLLQAADNEPSPPASPVVRAVEPPTPPPSTSPPPASFVEYEAEVEDDYGYDYEEDYEIATRRRFWIRIGRPFHSNREHFWIGSGVKARFYRPGVWRFNEGGLWQEARLGQPVLNAGLPNDELGGGHSRAGVDFGLDFGASEYAHGEQSSNLAAMNGDPLRHGNYLQAKPAVGVGENFAEDSEGEPSNLAEDSEDEPSNAEDEANGEDGVEEANGEDGAEEANGDDGEEDNEDDLEPAHSAAPNSPNSPNSANPRTGDEFAILGLAFSILGFLLSSLILVILILNRKAEKNEA
ncbi:MAG: hypothetical protein LBE35_10950 [Clostridiales bacterium]|nr:hypothetical protein [Clostridiales bacterium]